MLSPCLGGFSPGSLVSTHIPENLHGILIEHSEIVLWCDCNCELLFVYVDPAIDQRRVSPAYCPKSAGIGSRMLTTIVRIKRLT